MSTDPVTEASARLFALGVPADERMAALRVLGALIDGAGAWGMVRPDPEALSDQLGMHPDEITHHVASLDRVGVLEPHADAWRVVGAPARPANGPSVATAMAIIADEMGHHPAARRRRLVPITAAAAIVAVVMGALSLGGRPAPGGSPEQQVAVEPFDEAPGASPDRTITAPPVERGVAGADGPAAGTGAGGLPTHAADGTRGHVANRTGPPTCAPTELPARIHSISSDVQPVVMAGSVASPAGVDGEALTISAIRVDGVEVALAQPLALAGGTTALWSAELPADVAARVTGADPAEVVVTASAAPATCA